MDERRSKQDAARPNLEALGWDARWQAELEGRPPDLVPARVGSAVHGQLLLLGLEDSGETWASARRRVIDEQDGPPVVGDWVLALRDRQGGGTVVEHLLERRSAFVRKSAGQEARAQVIAANLDRVFVVTDVGRDFNPRRIERYLTTVWEGGAEPVIVVNKTDQPHEPAALLAELEVVALGTRIVMASAIAEQGLDELFDLRETGRTVALVGSSGVGKSTIINRLLGTERQATSEVRPGDQKGRHKTTRQELIVTPRGALLVDTPGIRELGLWDAEAGLERTFADLLEIAEGCRFRDCGHDGEPGCAVEAAIADGRLEPGRLDSFRRLKREIAYTASRADARTGANAKRRWKELSKVVRRFHRTNEELGRRGK